MMTRSDYQDIADALIEAYNNCNLRSEVNGVTEVNRQLEKRLMKHENFDLKKFDDYVEDGIKDMNVSEY